MVNITSLTGNGLKDWLIQRVTAVYFFLYVWGFIGYLWLHPLHNYIEVSSLLHNSFVQITTIMALFMLSLHAWIGLWTVTTDYLKHTMLRVLVQVCIAVFLLGQFVWGILVLWGPL